MSAVEYVVALDRPRAIWMHVRFESSRRGITDYAVVLTMPHGRGRRAVRVYDAAHGFNEMHRYRQTAARSPASPSTRVRLVKACARRSPRSAPATTA